MFNTDQDPYDALRKIVAEQTRPILAWVGSGVSASAGLPTWPALRQVLIEGLQKKADSVESSEQTRLYAAAERARTEKSAWVAFEILRRHLGSTSFRDLVRGQFADVQRLPTPTIYEDLWKLRIKGMLTLNLDRLAARSLGEAHPGQTLIELSGDAVERLRTNLSGHRPIIANLHGIFEDTATWVFTHKQLDDVSKKPAYQGFLETCLSMFTIIFVGISADDIAVGGHLERLRRLDIELPTHFWITDRQEYYTDQWAEAVGIRVIRYKAHDSDHSELSELFRDLGAFVSQDSENLPPVNSVVAGAVKNDLPTEKEILTRSADDIRAILNTHAQSLLADQSVDAYQAYKDFCLRYDQAIYQAWYVSTQPGKNELLGYKLIEHVARGAFGNVYRAIAPGGSQVAIKILLDEVRQDPQALQSFRRGVKSMRILEERQVRGMASYLEASEIPAFVVMEWVDGPNLTQAKRAKRIDDWYSVLKIAEKLTKTIRSAHMLPERVLHRDLRPANVMLRNFWIEETEYDVVVLDFDLSWHRGALEQSVLHTTSTGYLAPEQLRPNKAASTRSAFVDAFGIGMTLFYICGGCEPIADQHLHNSWEQDVLDACAPLLRPRWISLPRRVARLILACTRHAQSERWDLAEIERELVLLGVALEGKDTIHPELLAEEIAARAEVFCDYIWNENEAEAYKDLGTGLSLGLRAELRDNEIEARAHYVSDGSGDRAKLKRYLSETANSLRDQFRAAGWSVTTCEAGSGHMDVRAWVMSDTVTDNLDDIASMIDRLFGNLKMDRV